MFEEIGDFIEWNICELLSRAVQLDPKNDIEYTYLRNEKTLDYTISYAFGRDLIVSSLELKQGEVLYIPMKEKGINIKIATPLPLYIKTIIKIADKLEEMI